MLLIFQILSLINTLFFGFLLGSILQDLMDLFTEDSNYFIIDHHSFYGVFKYPVLCTDFLSFGDTFLVSQFPLPFCKYLTLLLLELTLLLLHITQCTNISELLP